jgi:hypothetical protein
MKIWLRSDLGIAPGVTTVPAWLDQSGHGHHCFQNTSGNRPSYVLSAMNGIPGLQFDGLDDYLEGLGTLGFGLSNWTVMVVSKMDDVTNHATFDTAPALLTNSGAMMIQEGTARRARSHSAGIQALYTFP